MQAWTADVGRFVSKFDLEMKPTELNVSKALTQYEYMLAHYAQVSEFRKFCGEDNRSRADFYLREVNLAHMEHAPLSHRLKLSPGLYDRYVRDAY